MYGSSGPPLPSLRCLPRVQGPPFRSGGALRSSFNRFDTASTGRRSRSLCCNRWYTGWSLFLSSAVNDGKIPRRCEFPTGMGVYPCRRRAYKSTTVLIPHTTQSVWYIHRHLNICVSDSNEWRHIANACRTRYEDVSMTEVHTSTTTTHDVCNTDVGKMQ